MADGNNGKTVLVTGGAGYIGSHCVLTLQQAGYDVVALDNFANSVDDGSDGSIALKRVEKITGKPVQFYKCDLLDTQHLEKIFQNVSGIFRCYDDERLKRQVSSSFAQMIMSFEIIWYSIELSR